MVNLMNFSAAVRNEIRRALRNYAYEKSPGGILIQGAGLLFGGCFGSKALEEGADPRDLAWAFGPNAVGNEFINATLNAMFNGGSPPANWYVAPFTTNLAPTSAITAATFAGTQGEYTGYSEGTRQVWTSNATSSAQVVSNSAAAATFTIAGSPATLEGAALLTASGKGATTGTYGAGGLFGVANTINIGGKLLVTYQMTGTST